MLSSALYERRSIQHDIMQGIEKDIALCQNELFAIEKLYDPTLERHWKLRKLDLNRESRLGQASYWGDLGRVHQEIRDTMIDYIKERQMEDLFR